MQGQNLRNPVDAMLEINLDAENEKMIKLIDELL
jgi:hypothetical protein